jgi:hypothetical protein
MKQTCILCDEPMPRRHWWSRRLVEPQHDPTGPDGRACWLAVCAKMTHHQVPAGPLGWGVYGVQDVD